jgi:hypothetical protein
MLHHTEADAVRRWCPLAPPLDDLTAAEAIQVRRHLAAIDAARSEADRDEECRRLREFLNPASVA